MDAEQCRRVLAACLPDLPVSEVRYLAEGWDSTVFLVNETLLLRFPKREEVAAVLARELCLLPALGPTLPVPIPAFTVSAGPCGDFPFLFAGYRLIAGTQLHECALTPEATTTVAIDTGRFLRALHAFPLDRARALGVAPALVAGVKESAVAFARIARERVAPLLPPAEAARLVAWLDAAVAEGFHDFTPVLVHADLGPEHLLVDPSTGHLRGVIDFGDSGTGDPAIDIAGALTALGEEAMPALLEAYDRPWDTALLQRARRYRALGPLHEVLYGLDYGGAAFVESGLDGLRRRVFGGE